MGVAGRSRRTSARSGSFFIKISFFKSGETERETWLPRIEIASDAIDMPQTLRSASRRLSRTRESEERSARALWRKKEICSATVVKDTQKNVED